MSSNKTNHFPWIDWIRFLAAFLVMAVHSRAYTLQSYGQLDESSKGLAAMLFYVITRLGNLGVLSFFVLSGFLVGGKVLERYRNGTFALRDYAIDRFSRIVVPFVPALAFTVIVASYFDVGGGFREFTGNLVFLQGIAVPAYPGNEPLWSISYEVWFYVLAGAGCCLVVGKNTILPLLALLVGMCIFVWLDPILLLCWCVGAFAYAGRPIARSRMVFSIALICITYGFVCDQIQSEAQTQKIKEIAANYARWLPPPAFGKLVFCAGMGMILQQIILWKPNGEKLVKLERFGTYLASFSYTLYLIHNPVLVMLSKLGMERSYRFDLYYLMKYSIVLLFCCIVAMVFYFIFERNTSKIRNRIKRISN